AELEEVAALTSQPGGRAAAPAPRRAASDAPRTVRPRRTAPDGPYRGRILDHLGRPLEGVDVELQPWEEANELGLRNSGFGQPARLTLEATTDADGQFVVERKKPLGLTVGLTASARGYLRTPLKLVLAADGSGDFGEITLEPAVVITGWVRDERNAPVAGARVRRIERDGDGMVDVLDQIGFSKLLDLVETDADGRFELKHEPEGTIVLRVESDQILPARYDGPSKRGGDVVEDIVIRVERAGRIVGSVSGYPRGRLRGTVAAAPIDPGTDRKAKSGMSAIMSARMSPAGEHVGKIEADGSFTIGGLTPGAEYEIRGIERQMFVETVSITDSAEAVAGGSAVTLRFDPGASLKFRAIDRETRKPVEALEVHARWSGRAARTMVTPTGSDPPRRFPGGEVTLHELRPEGNRETLIVTVDAKGYLRATLPPIDVAPDAKIDARTIELEPAPRLRFRVIDAATREPVPRAKVSLAVTGAGLDDAAAMQSRMASGEAPRSVWAKTNSEGRCSLAGIDAPSVTLAVRARSYADYSVVGFAPAGPDATTEVVMSRGGAIEVVAIDDEGHAVEGVRAECRTMMSGRSSRSGRLTDETGAALFDSLALGTYEVRVMRSTQPRWGQTDDDDEQWTSVELERDEVTTVEINLPSAGGLDGIVTMDGEPVVGARVTLVEAKNAAVVERLITVQDEFRGFGNDRLSDTTGADGKFELSEVEIGSYVLIARHVDAAMPSTADVEVSSGNSTVEVEMLPTAVVGQIVDEAGDPVPGADIIVRPHDPNANMGERLTRAYLGLKSSMGRTDSEGRFRIVGVRADTPLEVFARADGFSDVCSDPVTIAPRETRDVGRLQVARSGSILVTILGDSLESRILFVTARPAEDETTANESLELVRAGRARIDGLAPGRWTIATRGTRRDGTQEGLVDEAGRTVEVKAGETTEVELER
ncbi:MAG: carboxypeptidase-like regulatory domain-containing protein, partial [Planctomycetota bacterium]